MKQPLIEPIQKEISSQFQSYAFWQKHIKNFLDPPSFLNPTVGLFLGGYVIAFIAIWQWYQGIWPLPVSVSYTHLRAHET